MKVSGILVGCCVMLSVGSVFAAPGKKDPVEKGLKEAYDEYQKKNYSAVTAKLREVIEMLEEKNVKRVEVVLPEQIGFWQGNDLVREDLSALGGGLSIKRTYNADKLSITVKLIKDSPFAQKWIEMLANEDLIRHSGKKIHSISGEQGIMENDRKMLMVINGEMLVEISGDSDCKSKDIVAFARDLDLRLIKKMK